VVWVFLPYRVAKRSTELFYTRLSYPFRVRSWTHHSHYWRLWGLFITTILRVGVSDWWIIINLSSRWSILSFITVNFTINLTRLKTFYRVICNLALALIDTLNHSISRKKVFDVDRSIPLYWTACCLAKLTHFAHNYSWCLCLAGLEQTYFSCCLYVFFSLKLVPSYEIYILKVCISVA